MKTRRVPFWQWPDEERLALLQRLTDRLAVPMAILAFIWFLIIVIELADLVPPTLLAYVYDVDIATWAFFAVEFSITPHKLGYLRDNWVTTLSVLLPFFSLAFCASSEPSLPSARLHLRAFSSVPTVPRRAPPISLAGAASSTSP